MQKMLDICMKKGLGGAFSIENAPHFVNIGSFNNFLSGFLCILPIVFILKCDIIDLSINEREVTKMVAYSLINCSSDYFSVGIYTSLDNLYVALKNCVKEDLRWDFSKQDIKTFYEIIKVNLDSEPLACYEFSRHGSNIEIDWKKVFDK